MKKNYRKGIFIVVYTIYNNEIFYLLLKRKLHWKGWEFPKAGVKEKESLIECAKRELKEETGLKPIEIRKFDMSGEYSYKRELKDRKGIKGQTFERVYLIKTKFNKNINLSLEHSDFKWLNFENSYELLTWSNQKRVLKEIHKYLLKNKYKGFRIGFTSSGKILVSGKSDITNEKLIKSNISDNEIVFHTLKPGSAFVVIKSLKPNKKDLKDAGIFCAKYSQDWRDNKSDVCVHYFKGKDILKDSKMKTGTFKVKSFKELNINKKEIIKNACK